MTNYVIEIDPVALAGMMVAVIAFFAHYLKLNLFPRIPMPEVPQGFQDAVTHAFALKVVAEASNAQVTSDAAALTTVTADANAKITAAQTLVDKSKAQAAIDAANLDQSRKALEALEEAYLVVGGTLPPAPVPATPA